MIFFKKRLSLYLYYSMFLSFMSMSSTMEVITPNKPIRDGNETLLSTNGTFEAGFFSPENSKNRYFGIWYKNIPNTVVWVANRESPLSDRSGVLELDSLGNLGINDGTRVKIWSSNATKKATHRSAMVQLQLLESGNMVVKDGDIHNISEGIILWESFNFPGDTLLPGMKIGFDTTTGQNWSLRSWKTLQDPTPGNFSFHIDARGLPQLVITQEDGSTIYRPGSWNGRSVSGLPINDDFVRYVFVMNRKQVFYEIKATNSSIIMRSRLLPQGYQVRLIWSDQTQQWDVKYPSQFDQCAGYASCGANTYCEIKGNERYCECLTGFRANSSNSVGKLSGCVPSRRRTTTLKECNAVDDFHTYQGMKLPDTSSAWYDKTISQHGCKKLCLSNCSCTAYAKLNISSNGSGCLHWFSDIVDMRKLPEGGQDFYLRLTPSSENRFNKKKLAGIVVGCILLISITICVLILLCIRRKKLVQTESIYRKDKFEKDDIDLTTYDFFTISNATNQFSQSNKLGQGGFGPVYKVLSSYAGGFRWWFAEFSLSFRTLFVWLVLGGAKAWWWLVVGAWC